MVNPGLTVGTAAKGTGGAMVGGAGGTGMALKTRLPWRARTPTGGGPCRTHAARARDNTPAAATGRRRRRRSRGSCRVTVDPPDVGETLARQRVRTPEPQPRQGGDGA